MADDSRGSESQPLLGSTSSSSETTAAAFQSIASLLPPDNAICPTIGVKNSVVSYLFMPPRGFGPSKNKILLIGGPLDRIPPFSLGTYIKSDDSTTREQVAYNTIRRMLLGFVAYFLGAFSAVALGDLIVSEHRDDLPGRQPIVPPVWNKVIDLNWYTFAWIGLVVSSVLLGIAACLHQKTIRESRCLQNINIEPLSVAHRQANSLSEESMAFIWSALIPFIGMLSAYLMVIYCYDEEYREEKISDPFFSFILALAVEGTNLAFVGLGALVGLVSSLMPANAPPVGSWDCGVLECLKVIDGNQDRTADNSNAEEGASTTSFCCCPTRSQVAAGIN